MLEFVKSGTAKTQVLQCHGNTELLQKWKELLASLGRQLLTAQAFFQAKLHQNSETHFLSMQCVVACRELGQPVVNGMGCHRSALSAPEAANDTSRQSAGFDNTTPGSTVFVRQCFD